MRQLMQALFAFIFFVFLFVFAFFAASCSDDVGRSGVQVNNANVFDNNTEEDIGGEDVDYREDVAEEDVLLHEDPDAAAESDTTIEDSDDGHHIDVPDGGVIDPPEVCGGGCEDLIDDLRVPDGDEDADVLPDVVAEDAGTDVPLDDGDMDAEGDAPTEDVFEDAEEDTESDTVEDWCATREYRWYDADGDGYGNPSDYIFVSVCDPPLAGYFVATDGQQDCNDADSTIHPGATEVCGDGTDQDCNGSDAVCFDGALEVSIAHSTPPSTILLGDSPDIVVAIYHITNRSTEVLDVQSLTFANCLTDVVETGCSAPGGDVAVAALRLSWTRGAATVRSVPRSFNSGVARFESALLWSLEPGEGLDLRVLVDLNAVEVSGVPSGTRFQVNLVGYRAVSAESGAETNELSHPVMGVANPFVVRKTKPTITLASGSPSGASVPGFGEVLRFNVAADARGFVGVSSLTFHVSSSDNVGSGWNSCSSLGRTDAWSLRKFFNDSSSELAGGMEFYSTSGEPCDTGPSATLGYVVLHLDAVEVSAGDTVTFALRGDTIGASSSADDFIRIDIPSQDQVDAYGLSPIRWDDDVWASRVDGWFIRDLPVNDRWLFF